MLRRARQAERATLRREPPFRLLLRRSRLRARARMLKDFERAAPASETLDRNERPRIAHPFLVAQDRGAFADRHADVIEIAKRQRREQAAIDGRLVALGQVVKNSFQNANRPGNPKIAVRMSQICRRHSHFTNP
jgi:hypothetical protein